MSSEMMHVSVGADPADLGKFRVGRWIRADAIRLPRVCIACGAPDAWNSVECGGSDAKGKYWIRLQMPLCSHCSEINDACGHFMGLHGKTREVKQEYKQIQRAVTMKVHRAFSGDLAANFVFRNKKFYEAFMAVNPMPEKKHWGQH